MSKSGITPIEYHVVVKPDPVEEKTAGGLYMPDAHKEREGYAQMKATIEAVSPMAFKRTASGDEWTCRAPAVGDRVLIAKYSGAGITGDDGEAYRVVKDEDIIAFVEGASNG